MRVTGNFTLFHLPIEIWRLILDHLSFIDLVTIMRVTRNLCWRIYQYLTHVLDSLLHFQTLDGPAIRIAMQATGAVIGGRTALGMLIRCSHEEINSDIEFSSHHAMPERSNAPFDARVSLPSRMSCHCLKKECSYVCIRLDEWGSAKTQSRQ